MDRLQKIEQALRDCVDVMIESVTMFQPGVYPKNMPYALNNANNLLGTLYTTCGSCDLFCSCVTESGKMLDSENGQYIDELLGTPSCSEYINSALCQIKDDDMPVVQEIGFYKESEKVGYIGWIKTIDGNYFIDIDGKITKPEM